MEVSGASRWLEPQPNEATMATAPSAASAATMRRVSLRMSWDSLQVVR